MTHTGCLSHSRACTRPQPLVKRQRVWGPLLRTPGLYRAARVTKLEKQEIGNAGRCDAYLTRLFQNTTPTALLLDQHFFLEQDNGTNIQYRNQMEILILQRLSSIWKSNHSVTKTRNSTAPRILFRNSSILYGHTSPKPLSGSLALERKLRG